MQQQPTAMPVIDVNLDEELYQCPERNIPQGRFAPFNSLPNASTANRQKRSICQETAFGK
jgi:hypothetical protein